MAFGKNPQGLNRAPSFRQQGHSWNSSRTEKKSFKGSGGGGGAPTWVNEYKPPKDDVDTIRIVPGDYTVQDADEKGNLTDIPNLAWFPFVEHYDARSGRSCVCSAGPHANDRTKKQPCHGCDLFWSSMKTDPATGKKQKGFMGKRDMSVFSVIHYWNYHKVEQVDNQGRVRTNNDGQPYYSWVRCKKSSEGKGICDACDANKETKRGNRMHWAMGTDHYNTLLAKDEDVGKCCVTCGGRDIIQNVAWLCPHPDCGDAVVDEHSRLTKKQIDEIVNRPAVCPTCKQEGFLVELISCETCTAAGHTPKRATLFDVDIKIRRNEPPDGSNRTTLDIVGFSNPKPVDKAYAEILKPEDLSKIYAPTPLEKQASLFNVQSTPQREPVTSQSASRPYGGQGGSGPNYGS